MRQRTIDTKTRDTKRGVSNKARGGKTGFVASEPTCEHVYTVKKKRKFNDDEVALLIGIRKELAEKGFRDGKIACVLAERFNRSQGSYREKIRHLVADGILAFNPGHIPRFSKEEDASIEKKRSVLIKKGKSDKEIAWLICGEINRNAAAAYRRILKLVHCGAIESNPAYRTPIQGPKFEKIKRLRLGLIPLGLDDMAIAARIATMMDGQKVLNVYSLIRSWVSKGRLKENPNRIPGFNKEELDKIAALWTNLVGTNISDEAISREISKLLPNRSPRSIHNKISELRKNGIIGNNPFLKPARKFNENEVEILIQIRKELVSSGFTDEDIAKKVGKRLGRSLSSTRKVISRLLRDGQIETNPHGRQSISEHDIQRITEIRRELIGSEMNDKKIASEIINGIESIEQKPIIELDTYETDNYVSELSDIILNRVKQDRRISNKEEVKRSLDRMMDELDQELGTKNLKENALLLYNEAMDLVRESQIAGEKTQELLLKAYSKVVEATHSNVSKSFDSTLQYVAASIAVDCGKLQEAEHHIAQGIASNPPENRLEEFRNLLAKLHFQQYLAFQGISLDFNEFQIVLIGNAIYDGNVPVHEFINRIDNVKKLVYRTIERKMGKDYRSGGGIDSKVRSYETHISNMQAASFAVSLKLREPIEPELPFVEEFKLPKAEEVIDELLDCFDLFNKSNEDALHKRIPDQTYYVNFVSLTKNMAPDGNDIRVVGFTAIRKGSKRGVQLTTARKDIDLSSNFDDESETDIERMTITGTLSLADDEMHSKEKVIGIKSGDKKYDVIVRSGLEDIIPLWNSTITLEVSRIKGKYYLEGILESIE